MYKPITKCLNCGTEIIEDTDNKDYCNYCVLEYIHLKATKNPAYTPLEYFCWE